MKNSGRGRWSGTGAVFVMVFVALLCWGIIVPAHAQRRAMPPIVRDTEIENILTAWMLPLLQAAGIDQNNFHIILVQDPQINAFVAGGSNIFLYTGLIQKTKNPGELLGVMAHELGHIAGGHLIATRSAYERASYESIVGMVLGIGAAALSGDGAAASAIMHGSQSMAQGRFLSHSRTQESSADQAALRFLDQAGYNPDGLVSFFGTVESEELLPVEQQSEYMRTHPLTRNRMDAVRGGAMKSAYHGQVWPPQMQDDYDRIKAKLLGFISPSSVVWTYNDRDDSTPAVYAKSIAAYRTNKIEPALSLMDVLLKREPDNPYFLELKGQMLMEFGRVAESVPFYRRAAALAPNPALIQIALARALLEMPHRDFLAREAVKNLVLAEKTEPRSPQLHRLLATAYGKMGDEPNAKLHLAEEAVLQGRYDYARTQAQYALENAPEEGSVRVQARDLLSYIDQKKPADL